MKIRMLKFFRSISGYPKPNPVQPKPEPSKQIRKSHKLDKFM